MSARDAESGSAFYRGGSGSAGGLGNGGIGGGRGAGLGGVGAGRMGGAGNQTGLGTGTTTFGNSAFGRPGGMAAGYGMMGRGGALGNLRNLDGSAMVPQAPAQPPGLLGGPQSMPAVMPSVMPASAIPPAVQNPFSQPAWGGVADFISSLRARLGAQPSAPGLSYNYNIRTYPGQGPGTFWGGSGLAGVNRPANRGPSSMPQSMPSTAGGYPSLNSVDTRPAGVY